MKGSGLGVDDTVDTRDDFVAPAGLLLTMNGFGRVKSLNSNLRGRKEQHEGNYVVWYYIFVDN